MMVDLHFMVDINFMIQIISLATVSLIWLVMLDNLSPMCKKKYLMVLDDCWISCIELSSSVLDEDRLFMELMQLSKSSDNLS